MLIFKIVYDKFAFRVIKKKKIYFFLFSAAEVLASDHAFVKTRPLSEATALSRTKARKSAEFLQPYRSRPETCAALARRLVTGALGVRLATARQEREHEKVVLREAKGNDTLNY